MRVGRVAPGCPGRASRRTPGSREISSLAPGVKDGRNGKKLDQLALNGVHYRFQAIVSP